MKACPKIRFNDTKCSYIMTGFLETRSCAFKTGLSLISHQLKDSHHAITVLHNKNKLVSNMLLNNKLNSFKQNTANYVDQCVQARQCSIINSKLRHQIFFNNQYQIFHPLKFLSNLFKFMLPLNFYSIICIPYNMLTSLIQLCTSNLQTGPIWV